MPHAPIKLHRTPDLVATHPEEEEKAVRLEFPVRVILADLLERVERLEARLTARDS